MEFRIAACDFICALLRVIMDGSPFSVDIRMVHIKERYLPLLLKTNSPLSCELHATYLYSFIGGYSFVFHFHQKEIK